MAFENWTFFGLKQKRDIPKLDDVKKKEDARDLLELENLDGYNIIESSYVINSISEGMTVLTKQSSLIDEYRQMALYYLVDDAIDDIVNGIVACDEDEEPISIILDALDDKKELQKKLLAEFDHVVNLMDFKEKCQDIVRSWYIDGQIAIHPIVDEKNQKVGINKLVFLDPRGVQKINKIKVEKGQSFNDKISEIEEFYIYDISRLKNGIKKSTSVFTTQDLLKISKNAMVVCTSGIYNADGSMVLSDLEKARKVLNDVKNMENAMVIYRLARATERKAFYIDTGTLPAKGAIAYLQEVMNKHRSAIVEYDTATGKVVTGKTNMAISEDYWLPRREGGRGTEISTVEGASNLGDIDDILLTQKKLTKSLNVPGSRLNEDASLVLGGRSAEVNREEWKFNKFIQRKRRQFTSVFNDLLRIQMILKGYCTEEEWNNDIQPNLKYDFASDSFQREQQELENLAQRLAILEQASSFVGEYFSPTTIERMVLGRTDDDISDEQKRIETDKKQGRIKEEPQDEQQ